jgi:hypothetical protein
LHQPGSADHENDDTVDEEEEEDDDDDVRDCQAEVRLKRDPSI